MRCNKRIVLSSHSETYCQREDLDENGQHKGKCSILPYNNICHLCNPDRSFASIIELEKHIKDTHRVWKG